MACHEGFFWEDRGIEKWFPGLVVFGLYSLIDGNVVC